MKVKKIFVAGLFVGVLFILLFYSIAPVDSFKNLIQGNSVISAILFILLMFAATVVAPVTVLPLVPFASALFGPLPTALYSILGWWLGAIVAFLIARYGGRPLLERYVSLDEIVKYESKIPKELTFGWLVLFRMIIPVDVLSYAVGLLSTISLKSYSLATAIGITPFAFIFSYGGSAFFDANYTLLVITAIFAVGVLGSVLYLLKIKQS